VKVPISEDGLKGQHREHSNWNGDSLYLYDIQTHKLLGSDQMQRRDQLKVFYLCHIISWCWLDHSNHQSSTALV